MAIKTYLGQTLINRTYIGSNQINSTVSGPTPEPPFTPADLTDVYYWWNTENGISETGGALQSWTDQINSTTLTLVSGTGMAYTASDSQFNDLPSIYNNGAYRTVRSANLESDWNSTDDFTLIFIGKPNVQTNDDYVYWGGQTYTASLAAEIVPYVSRQNSGVGPGQDQPGVRLFNVGGTPGAPGITEFDVVGVTNTGSLVYHIVSYDSSAGEIKQYWNSTSVNDTLTGISSSIDRTPFLFEIGGNDNVLSSVFEGYILECIVMKSVPTEQELQNIDAYVASKYL